MEEIKFPEFADPENVSEEDYIDQVKTYLVAQVFANLLGPINITDPTMENERIIDITYSGSGDSGGVDGVTPKNYFDYANVIRFPEISHGYRTEGELFTPFCRVTVKDRTLEDALISFCYSVLEHYYGGWENNEGADGCLFINAITGHVELEHTVYERASNTSNTVL